MFERISNRRKAAGEGGFTLIELLVVIIILGILAAVVVFAVGGVGDKGQSAACKIDERTIRTAEEAYAAQTVANGGGGGSYADQGLTDVAGDLVPNFLSEPPKYHTVTANNAATPKTFTITNVAPC